MPNRDLHAVESAPGGEPAAGVFALLPPTRTDVQVPPEREAKTLSDVRRAAAGPASRLLARAAGLTNGGPAAIARRLAVTATTMSRWLDDEDPAAMTVRDVMAGPKGFCRQVGAALVQFADENGPPPPSLSLEQHIVSLTRELGDVARADPSDPQRLDRELSELVAAAERARRELHGRAS